MQLPGRLTTEVRIQGVDTVDQPGAEEEAQGAVYRRGRVSTALLAQLTEDIVSADRRVALPDEFQDALANGSQSKSALGAQLLSGVQCVGHTALMIVLAARVGKAAYRGLHGRYFIIVCRKAPRAPPGARIPGCSTNEHIAREVQRTHSAECQAGGQQLGV